MKAHRFSGNDRRASIDACGRCGYKVLRAYDDDWMALRVAVDDVPLDALGELLVIMAGGQTYDMALRAGRYVIDARMAHDIAANPPMTRIGVDVVPQHRCGGWPFATRQRNTATQHDFAYEPWQPPF